MKKLTISLLILLFLSITHQSKAQGTTCLSAENFCTDIPFFIYPVGINMPTLGAIGCLGSTPNPKWYKLKILNPGNINIKLWTTPPGQPNAAPSNDIDYIMWGPFDSLETGCSLISMSPSSPGSHGPNSGPCPTTFGGYPSGSIVDCSYASDPIEYIHLQNAVQDKWYILLITNYSNQPCDVHIETQNQCSSGSTDCSKLYNSPTNDTVGVGGTSKLIADSIPGCMYAWSGPNNFNFTTNNSTLILNNITSNMMGNYYMTLIAPNGNQMPPKTCSLYVYENPTTPIINLITYKKDEDIFKIIFYKTTENFDSLFVVCNDSNNILFKQKYPSYINSINIPNTINCDNYGLIFKNGLGLKSDVSDLHKPLEITGFDYSLGYLKILFQPYSGLNLTNSTYKLLRKTNNGQWATISSQVFDENTNFIIDNLQSEDVFYQIEQTFNFPVYEILQNGSLITHYNLFSNISKFETNSSITNNENEKLLIYPNPAKDKLFFKLKNQNEGENSLTIIISDINGREMINDKISKNDFIDVSKLIEGVYFVKIIYSSSTIIKRIEIIR